MSLAGGAGAYLLGIWRARYFWLNLVGADLRARWRRSTLGILWTLLQPLGFTLLLSFVLGRLLQVPFADYAPYVLSGLLLWDFLTSTATGGAQAFLQADAYIRQHRQPLLIYTLRTTLTNLAILAIASLALVGWVLASRPETFGWCWLAALLIFPFALLLGWPLATLLAYPTVRFRDIAFALSLLLQAVWFVSPIYFLPAFFRAGGIGWLVDWNPLYHLLQLLRAPLLDGAWPSGTNLAVCAGAVLVLWILAALTAWRGEERVILYL